MAETPRDLEVAIVQTLDFGDLESSQRSFRGRVDAAGSSAARAAYLSQVARTQGLAGEYDAARATLDEAASLVADDSPGAETDHAHARIAIERGRVDNSSGAPGEALPHFAEAFELAKHAGTEGLAVDALHMTAIAAGQTQGASVATDANLTAIAYADASADPAAQRWLPSLLNNLGWSRHEATDYAQALELFERALVARREQGSSDNDLVVAEWAVARALRSLDRVDEALAIQQRLVESPIGAEDGYVAEEIAECLVALGRPDEAVPGPPAPTSSSARTPGWSTTRPTSSPASPPSPLTPTYPRRTCALDTRTGTSGHANVWTREPALPDTRTALPDTRTGTCRHARSPSRPHSALAPPGCAEICERLLSKHVSHESDGRLRDHRSEGDAGPRAPDAAGDPVPAAAARRRDRDPALARCRRHAVGDELAPAPPGGLRPGRGRTRARTDGRQRMWQATATGFRFEAPEPTRRRGPGGVPDARRRADGAATSSCPARWFAEVEPDLEPAGGSSPAWRTPGSR